MNLIEVVIGIFGLVTGFLLVTNTPIGLILLALQVIIFIAIMAIRSFIKKGP